jgi:hypothetical protein
MADKPRKNREKNTFSKNQLKPTTFFNPKTDLNPDQKPTIKQKTDPDPDRLPKVNPAGLYRQCHIAMHYIGHSQ